MFALNGAERDHILISREDAERLGLSGDDELVLHKVLHNDLGEFHGRAFIADIKPGSLQGHWPEINILLPTGRCDASGVPDYNTVVEVVAGTVWREQQRAKAQASGLD